MARRDEVCDCAGCRYQRLIDHIRQHPLTIVPRHLRIGTEVVSKNSQLYLDLMDQRKLIISMGGSIQ